MKDFVKYCKENKTKALLIATLSFALGVAISLALLRLL